WRWRTRARPQRPPDRLRRIISGGLRGWETVLQAPFVSPGAYHSWMLRLEGGASRFCDGVSRRSFLRIGGLGLGGLALPQILQAQAQSPQPARSGGLGHKAVIMIYMPGGPPHQDMYDLKMNAP